MRCPGKSLNKMEGFESYFQHLETALSIIVKDYNPNGSSKSEPGSQIDAEHVSGYFCHAKTAPINLQSTQKTITWK